MERDPDIRMLAMRMNSRQFPYIDFGNLPVRTNRAAEPIAIASELPDDAGTVALTAPEAPAVPKAPVLAAPEPPPIPTHQPVPAWTPPAQPAVATPPAWAPQPLQAPPPVAALRPRIAATDFPLIRNAMQEARDLATPPPRQAGGGGTADWLRARPSAAQV